MDSKQEVIVFEESNGVLNEVGKKTIEDTVSLKGKPNKLLDGYEYRCDKSTPLSLKNHHKYANVLKYGQCEIHPFRCKHRETVNGKTTDCKARVHLFVNNVGKTIGYCMVNNSHTNNCTKERCTKKILKRKIISDVVDMGKNTGYEVTKEIMEHVKKQKTDGSIKKQAIQMILNRHKTKIGLISPFTEAVQKYYNDWQMDPNKQTKIQTNESTGDIESTGRVFNHEMVDCESDASKSLQFTENLKSNQTESDIFDQLLIATDPKEALNHFLNNSNNDDNSMKGLNTLNEIDVLKHQKIDENKESESNDSEPSGQLELIIDKDDFDQFVNVGILEKKPEEFINANNLIVV